MNLHVYEAGEDRKNKSEISHINKITSNTTIFKQRHIYNPYISVGDDSPRASRSGVSVYSVRPYTIHIILD
jgi:hypothetical protein